MNYWWRAQIFSPSFRSLPINHDRVVLGGHNYGDLACVTVSIIIEEYDCVSVRCEAKRHLKEYFHENFVDALLWELLRVMRPLLAAIPVARSYYSMTMHSLLARAALSFVNSRTHYGR